MSVLGGLRNGVKTIAAEDGNVTRKEAWLMN